MRRSSGNLSAADLVSAADMPCDHCGTPVGDSCLTLSSMDRVVRLCLECARKLSYLLQHLSDLFIIVERDMYRQRSDLLPRLIDRLVSSHSNTAFRDLRVVTIGMPADEILVRTSNFSTKSETHHVRRWSEMREELLPADRE